MRQPAIREEGTPSGSVSSPRIAILGRTVSDKVALCQLDLDLWAEADIRPSVEV